MLARTAFTSPSTLRNSLANDDLGATLATFVSGGQSKSAGAFAHPTHSIQEPVRLTAMPHELSH